MTSETTVQARQLGFWLFLMSDALIFALLLTLYATMKHATDGGPGSGQTVELGSSLVQTLVLLVSSFTMAMVTLNERYRPQQIGPLLRWLGLTGVLGLVFIAMEAHDFGHLIDTGAVPRRSGYLSAFYVVVAAHGLHVVAGLVWTVVMMVQLKVFGVQPAVKFRLSCLSVYWHFLDVIWVCLYGLVYLLGASG